MARIVIFGASGRVGLDLVAKLLANGHEIIAITRNNAALLSQFQDKIQIFHHDVRQMIANDFQKIFQSHDIIINVAHARLTEFILPHCLPSQYFCNIGSMRIRSNVPNIASESVKNALILCEKSCPCPWVMINPTMIYGAKGERNIAVLLKLLRYMPLVLLPKGANQMVQPIHQSDVVEAIAQVVNLHYFPNHALNIAGASKISYHEMLKIIGASIGKKIKILELPKIFTPLLYLFLAIIGKDKDIILRLYEDKSLSDAEYNQFIHDLKMQPLTLIQGLQIKTNKKINNLAL